MKQKKLPMRTCIITREKLLKNELLRIVKSNDTVVVDPTGKLNGHGCYIKKNIDVITKAKNSKRLDKEFEMKIPDLLYDEMINIVSK